MGLFQRSSQRSQQHQHQPHHQPQHYHHQYGSDIARNPQVQSFAQNNVSNNYDIDEQENRKPSSASVATSNSKRRGILGGLIRGRSSQAPPPSSHRHQHLHHHQSPSPQHPQAPTHPQAPLAPSPLQNSVPFTPTTQQQLRQKLQEAQKVEQFLTQAGTFKPTIGGSDIEFLFNHIATPTAQQAAHLQQQQQQGKRNYQGQLKPTRDQPQRIDHHGDYIGRAGNQARTAAADPQRPVPTGHPRQTTHFAPTNGMGDHQHNYHHDPHDHQHQHTGRGGPLYDETNTPQHLRSSPQIQSHVDPAISNHDTYSIDSSKRSKGSSIIRSAKKTVRRGLFSQRSDLDAFESEEAYYNAMKALNEGRQFQNVSNAFIQHFNASDNANSSSAPSQPSNPQGISQDAKSQASNKSKKSRSSSNGRPSQSNKNTISNERNNSVNSTPPTTTATRPQDDGVSYKSRGSSQRSAAASSRESDVSLNTNHNAPTLKGILKTNGKFSGAKSDVGTPGDETTGDNDNKDGGGFDVYKSNSGDEMFIGIRPSSSSESSGLYTDEHELIELRACLNSSGDGDEKNPIVVTEEPTPPSQNHDRQGRQQQQKERFVPPAHLDRPKERREETPSQHSRHDRSAEEHRERAPSREKQRPRVHDDQKSVSERTERTTKTTHSQHGAIKPSLEKVHHDPVATLPHSGNKRSLDNTQDDTIMKDRAEKQSRSLYNESDDANLLQESNSGNSDNSDVLKAVQERFTEMVTTVGTFQEKQAKKIEEMKQSFMATLSPPPPEPTTKEISPEAGAELQIPQQMKPAAKTSLLTQPLTCNTGQQGSFDVKDGLTQKTATTAKQDDLYRQLMNADGQNVKNVAHNYVRERSTVTDPPPEATDPGNTVEYTQNNRVYQRAETQKLMLQPRFTSTEAVSQSLHAKLNDAMPEIPSQGEHYAGPSPPHIMDINPSSSSGEARENLRSYWESHGGEEKQYTQSPGIAPEQTDPSSHMGLILPDPRHHQQQEITPSRARAMQSPSRDYEKHVSSVVDPPPIGKGPSLDKDNRAMDGVVFSIESEDDSLLRDDSVYPMSRSPTVVPYNDVPIPAARSSFSMARSRQMSLIDSAASEDDTMSTVTTDLLNNGGEHQKDNEEKQIGSLIERLNNVERRNGRANDEYEPSVDQTIADEISEIKSLLQGLKSQNHRRINQQDPPPDNSNTRRDAPEMIRRDAPDRYDHDDSRNLIQKHSSGSSTASSGYVKQKLGQPDPAEGSNTITPRPVKTANFPTSAPRNDALNRTATFASDVNAIRERRECQTAPQQQTARLQPVPNNRQEPRQLFGNAKEDDNGNVDWPSEPTKVSVKDRVKQFHSKFSRNNGSNASYIGSQASHVGSLQGMEQTQPQYGGHTAVQSQGSRLEPKYSQHGHYPGDQSSFMAGQSYLGSQYGVEQTPSQFGRYANNSYIGSQPSYGHQGESILGSQLGVEETQSQFGRKIAGEEYDSYIGHQASNGHHAVYQPHVEQTQSQFGRNNISFGSQGETRRPVHSPHPSKKQHVHRQYHDTSSPHDEEFFYSRTESDLTTSVVLEQENHATEAGGARQQHKSSRAASYFDTLSAGVKAGGSFDSISDRYSGSTLSKHTRESTLGSHTLGSRTLDSRTIGSQTKTTMSGDNSTLGSATLSRSRGSNDDDTKTTLPNTADNGFRTKIFQNAKSHMQKMSKKGDINEPFKARILRVMDPLIGKSSSDDEDDEDDSTIPSTIRGNNNRTASPVKGYLPACHFFCG